MVPENLSSNMNNVATTTELNLLCYRWGTAYGVEYVNKLYSMVSRHLPIPHVFHCMTDTAEGLASGIVPHILPSDHFGGNWNKLMTFQENFLGLQGKFIVCMDIDIIIVGDISFLADKQENDFMIVKNWAKGVRGNSSIYRLRVGSHTHVWKDFVADPEAVVDRFHGKTRNGGDQRWMNHSIKDYAFFPEERVVSYKRHCSAKSLELKLPLIGNISTGFTGEAKIPEKASVVLFNGSPLPTDVSDSNYGRWKKAPFVNQHWR
jgi:hypothetical protein